MKQYNIFSAATPNYFHFFKMVAFGLKEFKRKDVKYIYHLFLDSEDIESYKQQISNLLSEDFDIKLHSLTLQKSKIKSPNTALHWTTYVRLLACQLFPSLDKILFLDLDILVINKGLEEFMDADLTNYYANAVIDVCQQHILLFQLQNTKTNNYFNAGVLMFNLKKIRQDGLDKKIYDAITNRWPVEEVKPIFFDQSLLNYLFKDNVLISDPKFNNNFHASMLSDLQAYNIQYGKWGYKNLIEMCSKVVIVHYAGKKPWSKDFNQHIPNMPAWQISWFLYEYFKNNKYM